MGDGSNMQGLESQQNILVVPVKVNVSAKTSVLYLSAYMPVRVTLMITGNN